MYYTALIGKPTDHSVSHVMFEELAKIAGVKTSYKHLKINLEEDQLAAALQSFKTLGFKGLNVTLPYKLSIMEHLDRLDEIIDELGAVNTVKIDTTLTGYNTDWQGIYLPIKDLSPSQQIKTVTIFGCGGAARAAIYAARQLGARDIHVIHRNNGENEKLEDLRQRADTLGITLHDYTNIRDYVLAADLVINTSSAGMVDNDATPFELQKLDGLDMAQKIYFEAVFKPLDTPLLSFFRSRNAQTIDGLWMMIYQGVAALSIWIDQPITVDKDQLETLHDVLEKELAYV